MTESNGIQFTQAYVEYQTKVNHNIRISAPQENAALAVAMLQTINQVGKKRYVIGEDAQKLLHLVMEPTITFPDTSENLWYVHDQIDSFVSTGEFKALRVSPLFTDLVETKELSAFEIKDYNKMKDSMMNIYQIELLSSTFIVLCQIILDYDSKIIYFDHLHDCPSCQETMLRDKYLAKKACHNCQQNIVHPIFRYTNTLHAMIFEKKYALKLGEQEFSTETLTFTATKKVPKEYGNGFKIKPVEHTYDFTVIRYDVRSSSELSSFVEESINSEEKRGNWLTLSDPNNIIYERIDIASYEKRLSRSAETITVSSHQRWQPSLKTKPTYYRVIAPKRKQDKVHE